MSIQLKKSVKKYVSTLIILSCSAALLSASCFAEEKKEKGTVASEGVSKEIVQLNKNNLEDLHKKLNLQPTQTDAWKRWSDKLTVDVKEQFSDDVKLNKHWSDRVSTELTTPEKIAHQQTHLKFHVARMQRQLDRLEEARVNTLAFYGTLSKDQQTIFDLFWSNTAFVHEHMHGSDDSGQ